MRLSSVFSANASAAEPKNGQNTAEMRRVIQQGRVDPPLFWLFALLLVLGLVTLFSASVPASISDSSDANPFFYIRQQAMYALFFVPAAFFISRIRVNVLQRFAAPLYIVSVILMILALFVEGQHGANRWLDIGALFGLPVDFSFQPSEIAKFSIILSLATMLTLKRHQLKSLKKGLLPFLVVLGFMAVLMILQRHLSGLLLVVGIGAVMMFVGGVPLHQLLTVGGIGSGALYLLVMYVPKFNSYIMPRIETWKDPFAVSSDDAYQIIQSLIAIGSGGLTGRGLGRSVQKHLYLPAMTNDFIFAIYCEELGLVGALVLIGLFGALLARGIILASRIPDRFSSLMMMGISVQIALQTALHIAVNINAFPCTGISLPFFSYGGTSLLLVLFEAALMLSISRQADKKQLAKHLPDGEADPPPKIAGAT